MYVVTRYCLAVLLANVYVISRQADSCSKDDLILITNLCRLRDCTAKKLMKEFPTKQ